MRNPFKRRQKALTGDAGVISALNSGFAPFQLLGSGSRDRITAIYNSAQGANYSWLYIKSPAVRTVIDCIVRNAGELDLCLYEIVDEKERKPLEDHPAARSMKDPGLNTTPDGLIRELWKDYLIHDNAYAILLPGVNGQTNISRIPAYMVEVQGSSMWQVDNYKVWPQGAWNSNGSWGGAGTWIDLSPDQVFHWHGENPLDPRIGLSHLDTLRGVIAEDAALQQANVELANAGLQENVWVSRPLEAPAWSNEAMEGFEGDLKNRLVRGRNGTPVVLEEGMEMHSFGITPHDAEMLQARQWMIGQIASEYGVPAGKVGLQATTTEDEEAFITDVLTPYCRNFTKMLDMRLLRQVYDLPDGCFEFNLDERMMGNARLTALTSASGVPPLLRNEARAKLGLPPVPGGDEMATPVNITLGEDPEQVIADRQPPAPKPGNGVMPIQDPNKPPQDGSYRQEDGPTPVASGNGGKALSGPDDGSQGTPDRVPQLLPARSADIERQRRNVDALQAVMQRYYNRLGRSAKAKAVDGIDWQRWDRELTDDLVGAFKTVVQHEGDIYALKFMGSNFNMDEVQNYLQAMAEGAAEAINDSIRGEIDQFGVDGALSRAPQHVKSAGTGLGARVTIWSREEAAKQSGTFPDADKDMGRE